MSKVLKEGNKGEDMEFTCILYLEGEERFSASSPYKACERMEKRVQEYLKERRPASGPESFIKYNVDDDLEKYENEVRAYKRLEPFALCPRLLDHGYYEFRCKDEEEFILYGYYIETELFGISLYQEYPQLASCAPGSTSLQAVEDIDDYFDYPEEVNQKIKKVLDRMHELGVVHHDMHGGNLLIKSGEIRVIDFELE